MIAILTVITVIAILMSVAAVGIKKLDQGQATITPLAISEGIFDEARSAAVGRASLARVLIHFDPAPDERERYLRYMVVAVGEPVDSDDDGLGDLDSDGRPIVEWEIDSRGSFLPSGVFFDQLATDEARSRIADIGTYGTTDMRLPGKNKTAVTCLYYEFNAEGLCVNMETPDEPGATFVLAGGVLPPNETVPRVRGNNRKGFVVWRNGRTAIFRNPDHITLNTQ